MPKNFILVGNYCKNMINGYLLSHSVLNCTIFPTFFPNIAQKTKLANVSFKHNSTYSYLVWEDTPLINHASIKLNDMKYLGTHSSIYYLPQTVSAILAK